MPPQNNQTDQSLFHPLFLWGFYIILCLPLLAMSPFFWPANWAKIIVLKIVVLLLLVLLLWRLVSEQGNTLLQKIIARFLKNKMVISALILFLLAMILATIFSQDVFFSLWGSPYRGEGLINFIFYIIFGLLLLFIPEKDDWPRLWRTAFVVAILVAFIGLFQQWGLFSKVLIPHPGSAPSTVGDSSFLAIYLLFFSFAAFFHLLSEKNIRLKWFYVGTIGLFLLVIFNSTVRAAYLGLVFGIFYFLFFYPKRKPWFKVIAVLIILLVLGAIFYINTNPLPNFVKHSQTLSSVTHKLVLPTIVGNERFFAWQISCKAWQEKPVLGWGPENFQIGFDKHYDPALPSMESLWWDRAHNIVFDLLVTTGIAGLLAYLFFFGILFWELQKAKKHLRSKENPCFSPLIPHTLQASFAAYLVALFFSFDSPTTYLALFFFVGYALYLLSEIKAPLQINNFSFPFSKYRLPIIIIALFFALWFIVGYCLFPLFSNAKLNQAEKLVATGRYQEGLDLMEQAVNQKTFIAPYLRLRYVDLLKACSSANPTEAQNYLKRGIDVLQYNIKVQPKFTRTWLFLGIFNDALASMEKDTKTREEMLKQSEYYLEKALALGPKHQEVAVEIINMHFIAKDYPKMKQAAEKCLDMNSRFAECHWYLGIAEIFMGNQARGEIHIQESKTFNRPDLNQLIAAYASQKNSKKLAEVYGILADAYPKNPNYFVAAASFNREIGDYKKALTYILPLYALDPGSKKELLGFLEKLENVDAPPEFFTTLAEVYQRLDEYAKAKQFLAKADALSQNIIALKPYPEFFTYIGYVYEQMGEYQEAQAQYAEAQEIYQNLIASYPTNPFFHYHLARAFKELEKYDAARIEAQKAIDLGISVRDEVEYFLTTVPTD